MATPIVAGEEGGSFGRSLLTRTGAEDRKRLLADPVFFRSGDQEGIEFGIGLVLALELCRKSQGNGEGFVADGYVAGTFRLPRRRSGLGVESGSESQEGE
jgi:hypothetical protein